MAPDLPPESPTAPSTSSSQPGSPHPFPSLSTGLNGRAGAVYPPNDASTTESSSDDYFTRAQRTARERQPSGVSSSTSRRLSFATANSSLGARPRLDAAELASTSDDDSSEGDSQDDDNALSSQGLGLSLATSPSKRSQGRRNTIVAPFSRPPSAVTSYGGPSRPGSAAVESVKLRDRLTPAGGNSRRALAGSSKLSTMPPSPPPSWGEQMSQPSGPRRSSREGEDVLASRDLKGKGKEVDTAPNPPRSYEMPLTDDPLDPLSSMYHGPGSASATEHESPRSRGRNGRNGTRAAHRQSLQRPPTLPHEPPPPPPAVTTTAPLSATSYSSTDSVASTSHVTISSTSRSAPSSSTGASSSAPAPPQPSLQQLLQTVDLSAALRLVQTLQSQQNQQQPATAPPPTSSTSVPSSVPSQAPSHPSFPPNSPLASALPPRHASSLNPYDAPPLSSHPSSSHLLNPPTASPAPSSTHEGAGGSATEEKKDRRRSLSIGFGVAAVGKRLRTSSTVSASPSQSGLARVAERVPDERASISPFRQRPFVVPKTAPSTSHSATPPSTPPSPTILPFPTPSTSLAGVKRRRSSSVDSVESRLEDRPTP
ncbi:hypothetical protein BCR35DRAFT_72691 [Leucosporidium creatinivorum]|uniref:Uncharacterized protein n=1 Tax=Leucosporidium creatinivorum TaxID=106004 RepID=A0A1Y2G568_9BASI|nr:hypothetical protein BCR35DRAFT_72691 [Leucosporidium creatinivorum]